jgi:EipB-like
MQPHRAEYSLRLGTAVNAPRIGTAMQDITLDCAGWHIKRDVSSEMSFTPSWKVSLVSKLDGEEQLNGNGFRYHAIQIQNGSESEADGKVQRTAGEIRAEIVSLNGLTKLVLPPSTLMPVAALSNLVDRLRAKSGSFPTVMYGAEAIGEAFRVDVEELDPNALRAAPRAIKPVAVPATQFWPVSMTFTRDLQLGQKPLFSVSAKVFNSGVLDRLTIDVGIVTVTADLKALEMHKAPACPGL